MKLKQNSLKQDDELPSGSDNEPNTSGNQDSICEAEHITKKDTPACLHAKVCPFSLCEPASDRMRAAFLNC